MSDIIIPSTGQLGNRQSGFSLIELMVAITLSLIILVALTTMFVTSSRARDEITRANQQIENGRYAMEVLTDDLRLAGYYGGYVVESTDPANLPNPCITNVTAPTAPVTLNDILGLHIQGYDNTGLSTECTNELDDRKPGTDVVVVRRVSTCVENATPVDPDCDTITNALYFQASQCSDEIDSGKYQNGNAFRLHTATFDRTRLDCATITDKRRFITHIYYIASDNTLRRAELKAGAFPVPTPLAEGIENMQLEYGIDDTPAVGGDGAPDRYSAAPANQGEWKDVMAVKINLLARSTDPSPGHTDTKTYALGLKADGTANNVGPFNDNVKRHVFQTVVRLSNPAGVRQQ